MPVSRPRRRCPPGSRILSLQGGTILRIPMSVRARGHALACARRDLAFGVSFGASAESSRYKVTPMEEDDLVYAFTNLRFTTYHGRPGISIDLEACADTALRSRLLPFAAMALLTYDRDLARLPQIAVRPSLFKLWRRIYAMGVSDESSEKRTMASPRKSGGIGRRWVRNVALHRKLTVGEGQGSFFVPSFPRLPFTQPRRPHGPAPIGSTSWC